MTQSGRVFVRPRQILEVRQQADGDILIAIVTWVKLKKSLCMIYT